MQITYFIGLVICFVVMVFGMVFTAGADGVGFAINFEQIGNFLDPSSVLITIGCTIAVIVASFPASRVAALPKHFKIMVNAKKNNPVYYIDELVELAQVARKNGLLALEERANQQTDPFFKQAIMLIVDANDPDRVRTILENDIDCMSSRHDDVAAMYEKGASVAPAFGMVGTLIGLINMLKNMNIESGGASSIGTDMGTALITTLYGCILAHVVFGPIASNLRARDEEEVLCKMIVVEGIMAIQSGENPKFLREKLLTFMAQRQREAAMGEGGGDGKKGKAPKAPKEKKKK